jgi:pyruvate/2-oxoglutarate dehydrogenase complex dihydrolipoamide acyltransferase (E2) component
MVAEHGLDVSQVPGTGIDGRVTKRDVEEYLARGGKEAVPAPPPKAKPAPPPAAPKAKPAPPPGVKVTPEGDQLIPFTPIRKTIAEHMVMSKRTSPHVHTFAEVDMRKVTAFRDEKKKEGVSLTYLPFIIRAAIEAIREFPILNAQVVGESTVIKKAIHIGVAVDTERGLIVPVIRNADEKSLLGLAKAVEDIAARAAAKKILPDELAGGTFSVTNPGRMGNLFGTPIINQPQVGILRMGQVVKRPVVIEANGEDAIVIRPMMYLCLGYDHRIVDGVAGNSFLFRVREILEAGEFHL